MKKEKIIENTIIYMFFAVFLFFGYSAISEENNGLSAELLKVHFLNVEQGDATLIETPSKEYILIDGGPDKSILNELGKILPANNKKINYLVLTHPHADHLSGLVYVLERYTVEKIYFSGATHDTPDFSAFLNEVKKNKVNLEILKGGDRVCYLEICIDILWPPEEKISEYDLNDSSIILKLTYGNIDYIFSGDASSDIQEDAFNKLNLDAEVLKVSHHGSSTGTSQELINSITPEVAVISVGKNNHFHHPSKSVVDMLSSLKILRTDQQGTITISTDGNTIHY